MMMSFARVLVWEASLPEEYYYEYITLANKKTIDQTKKEREVYERGEEFNEIKLPLPGWILGVRIKKNIILTKFPWIWQFYLLNRYILIVKVLNQELRKVHPDRSDSYSSMYCTCEIIDDLKSNYQGSNPGLFVYSHFKDPNIEIGKKYMILINTKITEERFYGKHYLILGSATDYHSFFPVLDGKIIDEHGVLRQGKNEILIDDYKKMLNDFVHKTAGVPYED